MRTGQPVAEALGGGNMEAAGSTHSALFDTLQGILPGVSLLVEPRPMSRGQLLAEAIGAKGSVVFSKPGRLMDSVVIAAGLTVLKNAMAPAQQTNSTRPKGPQR